MIVVEDGAAFALNDLGWLAFLERREAGDAVSAANFGCEISNMVINASDPTFQNGTALLFSHDPFADILVIESGRAVALAPDDWLAYVEDCLSGSADPLADYGTFLGAVAPPSEVLNGSCAGIMAAGIRGARAALLSAPALPQASVSRAA